MCLALLLGTDNPLQLGSVVYGSPMIVCYSGLVVRTSSNIPGETEDSDKNQLVHLFWRIIIPRTVNNFLKSLTWQYNHVGIDGLRQYLQKLQCCKPGLFKIYAELQKHFICTCLVFKQYCVELLNYQKAVVTSRVGSSI